MNRARHIFHLSQSKPREAAAEYAQLQDELVAKVNLQLVSKDDDLGSAQAIDLTPGVVGALAQLHSIRPHLDLQDAVVRAKVYASDGRAYAAEGRLELADEALRVARDAYVEALATSVDEFEYKVEWLEALAEHARIVEKRGKHEEALELLNKGLSYVTLFTVATAEGKDYASFGGSSGVTSSIASGRKDPGQFSSIGRDYLNRDLATMRLVRTGKKHIMGKRVFVGRNVNTRGEFALENEVEEFIARLALHAPAHPGFMTLSGEIGKAIKKLQMEQAKLQSATGVIRVQGGIVKKDRDIRVEVGTDRKKED